MGNQGKPKAHVRSARFEPLTSEPTQNRALDNRTMHKARPQGSELPLRRARRHPSPTPARGRQTSAVSAILHPSPSIHPSSWLRIGGRGRSKRRWSPRPVPSASQWLRVELRGGVLLTLYKDQDEAWLLWGKSACLPPSFPPDPQEPPDFDNPQKQSQS